jgi:hypothetical protein
MAYEVELARPDLPIPLSPLHKLTRLLQRHLLGLYWPTFETAYRVTATWAAVAITLAGVTFALPRAWHWIALAYSVLAGANVTVRTLALTTFERRQHVFEREWLAAQSQVLQGHRFDILRFTVQNHEGNDQAPPRIYNLTRPADVGELVRLRDEEFRQEHQTSWATIEFSYLAHDGTRAVAEVDRRLPEIHFIRGRPITRHALIRFPEARYVPRPEPSGLPAQQTSWLLAGPVLIAISEPAYGGTADPVRAPDAAAGRSELGSVR